MKPPLFLFIMALALWGACAQLLWLGVILGIALETLQFARLQRDFTNTDFNHVSDLSALLAGGSTFYFIVTNGITEGLLKTVIWLPITTLPLVLVQIISAAGHLRLRNLFYSLRRSTLPAADHPADLIYPYFVQVLLAASIATTNHFLFLPGALVVIAYALYSVRARHYSNWIWGILLVISLGAGIVIAIGLNQLQFLLEDWVIAWITTSEPNPYHTRTSIGDVGHLKFSDAIVWRVRSEQPLIKPLLIVDASYNFFDGITWSASNTFLPIISSGADGHFILGTKINPLAEIQVSGYTHDGQALLALPPATYSIRGLISSTVSMNSLGALKIAEAAPIVILQVEYTPEVIFRAPPSTADIDIPKWLQPLLMLVKNQISFNSGTSADIIEEVRRFFHDQFRYSLYLGNKPGGKTLKNFLMESRSGHCEYFATATTLLIRSFGIPARYITGYSVQEFSAAENQYVARYRHAHAWTQAYIEGAWQDVDTTPALWAETETQQRNFFEPIIDWFSWRWYYYNQWRAENKNDFSNWLLGGVLLVCAWLYWRLFRRPRIKAAPKKSEVIDQNLKVSAYFQMEMNMAKLGYPRAPGETPLYWLQRLKTEICPYLTDSAVLLVQAHYLLKYRPNAAKITLHAHLQELIARWRSEII